MSQPAFSWRPPAMPEYCAAVADAKGIPVDEVDTEWWAYAEWSEKKYPGMGLGGRSWESWCERSAPKYKSLSQGDKARLEAARAAREGEAERARREAEAYRKQAVSFEDYARILAQRDPLSHNPVERSIVALLEREGERGFLFRDWMALLPDQHTGSPGGRSELDAQRRRGYR